MNDIELIERGRRAYGGNAWAEAYECLAAAHHSSGLEAPDMELLSIAAIMTDRNEESAALRGRAHAAYLERGDIERAARTAVWTGLTLLQDGKFAQAGGWLARAHRLINEPYRDCVEQGYLLVPDGLRATMSGDSDAAYRIFSQAVSIGERFNDRDLTALARHAQGRALLAKGEVERGIALLDEAMLEATSEGVMPIVAGIVYCSVIDACRDIFDLKRAQEWTTVLDRWSVNQPDASPFRGQCLVFRVEFKGLHGQWAEALEEAAFASDRLSRPPAHSAAGAAFYQQGELHRLRGEFDPAEAAYRRASELGQSPHPGMALLRLEQGKVDTASAAIRREVEEAEEPQRRCRLLPAYVEIMVAFGDVESAEGAAGELQSLSEEIGAPFMSAVADYATGLVLLEGADPQAALPYLRRTQGIWRELDAPYEVARTCVLVGLACKALRDEDTCEVELDSARRMFGALGAAPALRRLDQIAGKAAPAGGLTGREVEVLGLIATGVTNREIASELVISEKTVARHIANIFVKIGASSRAAATAYAVKKGIA